ncbi:MAG: nuclear transport factor 2 family protein [Actinobacteria bacterium]|nr:MAG: nuclear transport factor 2 family protein [Actinomycetota bacterium]
MADIQEIVDRYLATFNESDADRRRAEISELYSPDGTYTDPHVQLRGPEQIDAFIASTQERFPGYEFRLGGPVDAHHNQARFQWHAAPAGDPEPVYVGFDVIVTDGGRVRGVYGFLDATSGS